MTFDCAFFDLLNNNKVYRKAWGNKAHIYLSKPHKKNGDKKIYIHINNSPTKSLWQVNQEDILADDWQCVEITRNHNNQKE